MRLFNIALVGLFLATCISCKTQNTEAKNMENEVIETIMARRSIRKYKAEPVKRETMDIILKCGINAPNGLNKQSWEVRVLDNPETIQKLQDHMVAANPGMDPEMVRGCFRGAPTLVLVANDSVYDFSAIDCGLLTENIVLSAWSLGVGSVCLASPIRFICNSPEAMAMLGFSEGYTPIICVGLGYADETPEAKPRDMAKVKYLD